VILAQFTAETRDSMATLSYDKNPKSLISSGIGSEPGHDKTSGQTNGQNDNS